MSASRSRSRMRRYSSRGPRTLTMLIDAGMLSRRSAAGPVAACSLMILPLAVVRPVHPRRAHRRADSRFSSPRAVSSEAVRRRNELGGDGRLGRCVAGEHDVEIGFGPDRREVVRVAYRAAHVVLTV